MKRALQRSCPSGDPEPTFARQCCKGLFYCSYYCGREFFDNKFKNMYKENSSHIGTPYQF